MPTLNCHLAVLRRAMAHLFWRTVTARGAVQSLTRVTYRAWWVKRDSLQTGILVPSLGGKLGDPTPPRTPS